MHNLTTDEMINRAAYENNVLALAIADNLQTDAVDLEKFEALESIVDNLTDELASKLDEDIQAHVDDYYLADDGDYLGEYEYLMTESGIDIKEIGNRFLATIHYGRHDSGLTEAAEEALSDFDETQWLDLEAAILEDTSASTMLEVRHTFSSPSWNDCFGFSMGEIEEEAVHWLEGFDPELREAIAEKCEHHLSGQYFYINLSDSFPTWSIDLEWLETYLTTEESTT